MMFDMNNLKMINDTYGHDCGDQLLNGFAERLQSALSTAGTLIRLGGDEFIAILYGVSERCIAGERFRRMLEAIGSEPYHLEGIDLNPAVSMGLALYPSEADSLEALMRRPMPTCTNTRSAAVAGTGLKRPLRLMGRLVVRACKSTVL